MTADYDQIWIEREGVRLHVVVDGRADAPALVLFNGARCNLSMWEPIMSRLTERFRVVRHDVRGTGQSAAPTTADFNLDTYADDAAAAMSHVGIAHASIWGLAFGARVALAFAARHPDLVDALVLSDASVEPPDPEAQRLGAAEAKAARAEAGIAEFERRDEWFVNESPETLALSLRGAYAGGNHARYVDAVRARTLVATGEYDPNLEPSRRLGAALKDAELREVPLVGHGSVMQRPDLVADLVLEFFDQRV